MLQRRGEKGRNGESLWEGGGRGARRGEKSDPETDGHLGAHFDQVPSPPTAEW